MPVEIAKACSAWGGWSVLHVVLGVWHTVPRPTRSPRDELDKIKEKRNRGTNMAMAGRSAPPETWVRWDGRRPGGHCFTNYRCLVAEEVSVAAVFWLLALAWGHPTR